MENDDPIFAVEYLVRFDERGGVFQPLKIRRVKDDAEGDALVDEWRAAWPASDVAGDGVEQTCQRRATVCGAMGPKNPTISEMWRAVLVMEEQKWGRRIRMAKSYVG